MRRASCTMDAAERARVPGSCPLPASPGPYGVPPMPRFTSRELALHAARLVLDKGAQEVRVMAMPPGAALFDYVVLASARSDRQTHALVEAVYRFCKQHKVGRHPVEG